MATKTTGRISPKDYCPFVSASQETRPWRLSLRYTPSPRLPPFLPPRRRPVSKAPWLYYQADEGIDI